MKMIMRFLTVLLTVFAFGVSGYASAAPVADMTIGSSFISWQPKVGYKQLVLTVSCPDGSVISKTFDGFSSPNFDLSSVTGPTIEGSYTYELKVIPNISKQARSEEGYLPLQEKLSQSGHFTVQGSSFVSPLGGSEDLAGSMAVVHTQDTTIQGSLCVGIDCSTSESYGSDTFRLKENNLRIHFDDTSNSASFPKNDWRIEINSNENGGAEYFAIQDATAGKYPFKVEAGAGNNALYVDSNSRVGIGTSTPVVELHVVDGDTPTMRLQQDGSQGWGSQTWDVAGNESNFFIRDVTNGSKLSFRIQPGAPESTLTLRANGRIGQGTWGPSYMFHQKTDSSTNAQFVAERTSGASAILSATASNAYIGALSDHSLRLTVNNSWVMQLNKSGSATLIDMVDGGSYDGTWNDACSRDLKENIQELSTEEAMTALEKLDPVKYNYKLYKDENRVGFIAEDVPELVAKNDRKNLSTMDIVAVLAKVVKEQQKTIDELKKEIMKDNEK